MVREAKDKYPECEAVVSAYTFEIVWVNKKLADISEYTQEELIGRSIREIVDVDTETLLSFISDRENETQTIITKSGTRIEGTTSIKTFTYDDEPYFVTFGSTFEKSDNN